MYQKVQLNDKYTIDTDGFVTNITTGITMRGTTITKKNRYVKIHLDKFYALHLLVAQTFLGAKPEGYTVDHIDGNRYNNSLANLEYVKHTENVRRSRDKLQNRGQYGADIGTAKLSGVQARLIMNLKGSGLTARQVVTRYKLPCSPNAVKSIWKGKTWSRYLSGDIPEQCYPTPYKEPLKVAHNRKVTDYEVQQIQANAHLLRKHGGKSGLSIGQLLKRLDLTHIAKGTAYLWAKKQKV